MLEKILLKLKAQLAAVDVEKGTKSNVTERSLMDTAKSLVSVITTDELLEKLDFSVAIASFDGNINHHTAEAVKTIGTKTLDDYKKSEGEKSKKEAEKKAVELKAAEDKKNGITPPDPVIAQLVEQNKLIMEQLQGMKTKEVTQTRGELLASVIKETPTIYRDATKQGFDRMNFATEEDFNTYLGEIKVSAEAAIQTGKESNLNVHTPNSDVQKPVKDGQTPELSSALKKSSDAKKALEDKGAK